MHGALYTNNQALPGKSTLTRIVAVTQFHVTCLGPSSNSPGQGGPGAGKPRLLAPPLPPAPTQRCSPPEHSVPVPTYFCFIDSFENCRKVVDTIPLKESHWNLQPNLWGAGAEVRGV